MSAKPPSIYINYIYIGERGEITCKTIKPKQHGNEVLKAIRERRSIRRYKPEQITDEELRAVLEAGTWAATGMGKQDPWIVAVQIPRSATGSAR